MKTTLKNLSTQKNAKGFTLIELMIVVAIIGILAAVALPQYQDYTKKSKFTEVVSLVGAARTAVALCYQTQGKLDDCDHGFKGIPEEVTTGTYDNLDTMTIENGVITAKSTAASDSVEMIATPTAGNPLTWKVTSGSTPSCVVNGWC